LWDRSPGRDCAAAIISRTLNKPALITRSKGQV
jgi:hypothetical protein